MKDESFLSRWSRLKRRGGAAEATPPAAPPVPAPPAPPPAGPPASASAESPAPGGRDPAPPLPPLETLTGDSDFSAFMHEKVDEAVRRAALKKLFSDPRFNIMDGLDVYIDDYSRPDPLPPDWLAKMNQVSHLVVKEAPEAAEEGAVQPAGEDAPAAADEVQASPPEPGENPPDQGLARHEDSQGQPGADAPAPKSHAEPPAA